MTRRTNLRVVLLLFSLAMSSCTNFAQEESRRSDGQERPATKPKSTEPPPKPLVTSTSTEEPNEPSSDELEKNTPREVRELTRCAIEEIVIITPGETNVASFTVAFDSSASLAPCGKIVKSIWSFGDGTKSREAKVTHTYAAPGDYTVRLELTDDRGNRNLIDIEYAVMVTAENVSTERRLNKKRNM